MSNIAFIDVETDSLRAHTGHLLEIACLVIDENLNVLDKEGYHAVVRYGSPFAITKMRDEADPIVQEMHDRTGLWKKLSGIEARPLLSIDSGLTGYLMGFGEPGEMPVGGNSVRLDMNFIDEHLPQVSKYLHYQMRDVTTVAKLAQDWCDLPPFEKASDHTAMVDIQDSIRELRYYREAAFRKPITDETRELATRLATLGSQMRENENKALIAEAVDYIFGPGVSLVSEAARIAELRIDLDGRDRSIAEKDAKIAELERQLASKKRSNAKLAEQYVEAERARQQQVSETEGIPGLRLHVHGHNMSRGFAEWLDAAEVTLMDFALTVVVEGFPAAVTLVEARRPHDGAE